MITIPGADRKWAGNFESDIYGAFVAAKNITLDKKGYMRLAKKAMVLLTENDNSHLTTPLVISADATQLWILTTASLFAIDISSFTLTDYATGAPNLGFQSDMVFFNSQAHATGSTNMKSLNQSGGGNWTSRITGLNASYPHPMAIHGGRQTLLVADGNVCRQYDTSYVRDTTNELTIPSDYIITRIIYRDSKAYLLTRNINGGRAALIVWGGTGVGNNGLFPVPCHWIYSGCEDDSLIAIMLSTGQLWHFNGSGFKELAALPVHFTDYSWGSNASVSNLIGKVASRGMETDGSDILININGELENDQGSAASLYMPSMPSGLWRYNADTGLYPVAGVNYKKHHSLSPTGVASNALVFASDHELLTGDPVLCKGASGLNTESGQTYYAIYIGSRAVKLALSAAQAKAGIAFTLSGTPNAGDIFAMDSYGSYGSGQVISAGGVFVMKELIPNLFFGTHVFFGARALDNNGNSLGSIMSLGMGRNQGYFVSPKIGSTSVDEAFQQLVSKFPHLNFESESIVVKMRTDDRLSFPTHTTFGLAPVFASTTSVSVDPSQKDIETLEVGDELEFISASAAGYLAHITAIDTTNPALTVITFDETLPITVGDQTDFIAMNWKRRETFTTDTRTNTQNFGKTAIPGKGTWVQFKIVMRGTFGIGIEQLMLMSNPDKQPTG